MEEKLKRFTELLVKTTKMIKKADTTLEEQPIQAFTFIPDILDNIKEMHELEQNEGLVEGGNPEEQKEFKKALNKFVKRVQKEEVKEKGFGPTFLKNEEVVEYTASLEQLNEKING